ncbi:MAG: hypothetical protein ACFFFT_18055 [Candidatus Thorarchaeota archaeon]
MINKQRLSRIISKIEYELNSKECRCFVVNANKNGLIIEGNKTYKSFNEFCKVKKIREIDRIIFIPLKKQAGEPVDISKDNKIEIVNYIK